MFILLFCVAELREPAVVISLSLLLATDSPNKSHGHVWLCLLPPQAGREEEQTAGGGIQVSFQILNF